MSDRPASPDVAVLFDLTEGIEEAKRRRRLDRRWRYEVLRPSPADAVLHMWRPTASGITIELQAPARQWVATLQMARMVDALGLSSALAHRLLSTD